MKKCKNIVNDAAIIRWKPIFERLGQIFNNYIIDIETSVEL